MALYFAVPLVLVALLFAASGVAAITHGWVFPRWRRPVRRVRLYGSAQLVVAVAVCWQVVFATALDDSAWGESVSCALLLTVIVLMALS
ncbi:hypothetical protein [Streptomyces sp. NPDC052036]|uniref:hypothetical protein n=1 Tax=unclassified Streptomyces TaxID=2593676 RepID=UPI003444509D